jgi:recombination protein RecA
VVEKSGSWFSYDGQRIGQGRENAKTYLRQHPEVAEAIERKVRENAGILAGALDGSKEEDDEDEE